MNSAFGDLIWHGVKEGYMGHMGGEGVVRWEAGYDW